MRDLLLACSVAALLAVSSGCAICANSDDCTYPAYGGRWQRTDPCCGRVGSIFDPADVEIVETDVLPEGQTEAELPEGEVDDGADNAEEQGSVLAP